MARRKAPVVKEDVQCNLIPMVDIMFLLLLFFILGADMSQRETEDVILPQADMVQEQPKIIDEGEKTTTVNLFHLQDLKCPSNQRGLCRDPDHWRIAIRRQEYTLDMAKDQIKIEAEQSMETERDKLADKVLSARKVIIRADRSAPFGHVQKIIEFCGMAGIYKIEVGAAKPPAG